MTDQADLFHEWRVADRAAHALEVKLAGATLRSLDGSGAGPLRAERHEAETLREHANELFHLAMAEMKRRAIANRR